MFKHLLVPLDGSQLAEVALVPAAYLAQALNAQVTLIHVIEEDAPQEIHHDRHLARPEEAQAYLKEISTRAFPAEVHVETHVHTSQVKNVARSLVEHSHELNFDLVVMCTHGQSGPRDWLFGSIAQQVIAMGLTPVLLIPPKDGKSGGLPWQRILVPLDGTPEHEQGLPFAAGLAQICGAALYLLMVIPTLSTLKWERAATARMLPGAMSALLDLAEEGGRDYLVRRLAPLEQQKLLLSAEVARGDPVPVIVTTAQRVNASLIVFGTHGKAGIDAFWSGSVTPQVSSRTNVPLLLVPIETGH